MTAVALNLPDWSRTGSLTQNRQCLFEALVHAHARDLHRYALWLCHCPDTAQDLVQDTLLRAWRALDNLRDIDSARPWLLTILRRENARRFERPCLEISDPDIQASAPSVDCDTRIEALVLRNALARLASEYREPLLMQVLEGLSYAEIAARMELSEAAVTTRLHRARRKLLELLGEA